MNGCVCCARTCVRRVLIAAKQCKMVKHFQRKHHLLRLMRNKFGSSFSYFCVERWTSTARSCAVGHLLPFYFFSFQFHFDLLFLLQYLNIIIILRLSYSMLRLYFVFLSLCRVFITTCWLLPKGKIIISNSIMIMTIIFAAFSSCSLFWFSFFSMFKRH